jgi:hypothetical protein
LIKKLKSDLIKSKKRDLIKSKKKVFRFQGKDVHNNLAPSADAARRYTAWKSQ